jgi:aminomethyltransferase
VPCLVSRSGYTGEDGFEISIPLEHAERVVRRLLAHPEVRPIGLGARDTLRLEAGLPLYGQDMDAATSPVEAGLAWAIAKSRRAGGAKAGGFPGAERVFREQRNGPPRRFAGFVGVEAVPVRTGTVIADAGGRAVGVVTSGTVSPVLNRPIMCGYVEAAVASEAPLAAIVRGQPRPIERAPLPFVPKRYKRTG